MIGLYTFIFSVGLLENWVIRNFSGYTQIIIQSLVGNSSFLYGPLLYLFVHFLTTNESRFSKKKFLHFLPFILSLALELTIIISGIKVNRDLSEIMELIQFEILMIQILIYNVLAIKGLTKHHRSILYIYSNIENKDLNWLKSLLILITSIYILSFCLSHLLLFGISAAKNLFIIVQLAITGSIYLMTYRVIFQPDLFNFAVAVQQEPVNAVNNVQNNSREPIINSRYQKSGLKPEQATHYLNSLRDLLKNEKPYLNPELNIFSLAQLLSISKNHLTQVINESMNMNFYELINSYRIEEAKRLMKDPQYSNLNLTGIAEKSGFKSRTTFFTNFKKFSGITPQEWMKNQTEL